MEESGVLSAGEHEPKNSEADLSKESCLFCRFCSFLFSNRLINGGSGHLVFLLPVRLKETKPNTAHVHDKPPLRLRLLGSVRSVPSPHVCTQSPRFISHTLNVHILLYFNCVSMEMKRFNDFSMAQIHKVTLHSRNHWTPGASKHVS